MLGSVLGLMLPRLVWLTTDLRIKKNVPNRNLTSFPTRRSSDLGRAAAVVEAHERVGDHEAALRERRPVGRQRHLRLELGDVVVGEVADHGLTELLGLLEGDEPRARAEERMPPQPAVLDRLEQEARAAGFTQPEVSPERGEQVGGDVRGRCHEQASEGYAQPMSRSVIVAAVRTPFG